MQLRRPFGTELPGGSSSLRGAPCPLAEPAAPAACPPGDPGGAPGRGSRTVPSWLPAGRGPKRPVLVLLPAIQSCSGLRFAPLSGPFFIWLCFRSPEFPRSESAGAAHIPPGCHNTGKHVPLSHAGAKETQRRAAFPAPRSSPRAAESPANPGNAPKAPEGPLDCCRREGSFYRHVKKNNKK